MTGSSGIRSAVTHIPATARLAASPSVRSAVVAIARLLRTARKAEPQARLNRRNEQTQPSDPAIS